MSLQLKPKFKVGDTVIIIYPSQKNYHSRFGKTATVKKISTRFILGEFNGFVYQLEYTYPESGKTYLVSYHECYLL